MKILLTVKASLLLDEIRKWKATGVPTEYFFVDRASIREDNDAEDMIAVMKVDNHEDRKTNDDVDSEVIQGEAGTNDNDHEDSVVDDASII